jgi:hypothetical protein
MRLQKIILTLITMFTAGLCYSADHSITICSVQANDNGRAYIAPCGAWTTKNNCPSTAGWLTWDANTEGGRLMYSNAITALSMKLPVTVRTDGHSCASYDITSIIRISRANN